MDRLFRVHFGRRIRLQYKLSARPQFAKMLARFLFDHPEIVHLQFAVRHSHPATLVAMVVDWAFLSNIPADRNQLKETGLQDQIARVMIGIEVKVWRQRLFIDSVYP